MSEMNVIDIPMREVFQDPNFNCRGVINPMTCADLANNMARDGQLHPILIRPYKSEEYPDAKYQIVEGSRRYVAAKINRWETIKAVVRADLTEEQAATINLTENLQRENLSFMQEVRALKKFKIGIIEDSLIARRLNVSVNWVKIRREASDLPDDIQRDVEAGYFTQKEISELHKMRHKPEQMYEAVRTIKSAKIRGVKPNFQTVETKRMNLSKAKHRRPQEIFAMQDHVREAFRAQAEESEREIPDEVQAVIRALGWAGGAINDMALYYDLEIIANRYGFEYNRPAEVEEVLS